jgi:hypothetical protein
MRRDDPVEEPWYEIEFRMTRWRCPEGVSGPLLDDIIEATQETDRLLLDALKLVDSYAYGFDSNPKRYLRYSHIEHLNADFEQMEVRMLIADHALAKRWSSLMTKHKEQVASLSAEIQACLQHPEAGYSIQFKTHEVEIDDSLKQFLESIQPGS